MEKRKNNGIILSIIIPTFNRIEDLRLAISSILNQHIDHKSIEIIVIDNGPSTDGTDIYMKDIESKYEFINYISTKEKGCIIARKLGSELARGKILLTIDDDIEFLNNRALEEIINSFNNKNIVMVGGLELYDPKKIPSVNFDFKLLKNKIGEVSKWGNFTGNYECLDGHVNLVNVMQFRSCCMAIRKDIYEKIGGFNQIYNANGMGFRYETDLCLKAVKYGRVVINPKARIWHKVAPRSRGFGRGKGKDYFYYSNRNHTFFMLRFFWSKNSLLWLLFDIFIGTYGNPGIFYVFRRRIFNFSYIKSIFCGKKDGYKMFFHNRL